MTENKAEAMTYQGKTLVYVYLDKLELEALNLYARDYKKTIARVLRDTTLDLLHDLGYLANASNEQGAKK
jgi:hypothetical protein